MHTWKYGEALGDATHACAHTHTYPYILSLSCIRSTSTVSNHLSVLCIAPFFKPFTVWNVLLHWTQSYAFLKSPFKWCLFYQTFLGTLRVNLSPLLCVPGHHRPTHHTAAGSSQPQGWPMALPNNWGKQCSGVRYNISLLNTWVNESTHVTPRKVFYKADFNFDKANGIYLYKRYQI